MSKLAPVKGPSGKKYEGFNSMIIKKEEVDSALVDKYPSPKRKRGTSNEVIILDDDSDSKMDIDNGTGLRDEVISVESSEDDEILKKLPASKRKKGRSFVNFMDYDSNDDEDGKDNDVESEVDAPDADDASEDDKIIETDENIDATNDKDEHKKGFTESDEELF